MISPVYKEALREFRGNSFADPKDFSEPWMSTEITTMDSLGRPHKMRALVAVFRPGFLYTAYGDDRFGKANDPSWIVDVEVHSLEVPSKPSLLHNERRVRTREEAIERAAKARAWLERPDSVAAMQAIPAHGPLSIKKTDFSGWRR